MDRILVAKVIANLIEKYILYKRYMNDTKFDTNDKSIDIDKWTFNIENLVRTWAFQALLRRDMHNENAKKYKIMSGRLTIPLILLTTLTSVGSFGAVDSQQYKIWMYTTGALNLFAAFLASMSKYLKPDEKCSNHMRTCKLYDNLFRDISIQLSMAPEERSNADEFIQNTKDKLERLMNDSPMITENISKRILKDHNIESPDDFDIVIYGRENENKCHNDLVAAQI
jgi:hypothetical protein